MIKSDDPIDFQGGSTAVFESYCHVALVAVPPNFDIENHLTMREQAGIFEQRGISIKHLNAISMGVQCTPVFSLLNNPSVSVQSMAYFLSVLYQLGFIIKGINGDTTPYDDYSDLIEHYNSRPGGTIYFRGHDAKTINFVIINMIQIINNETVDAAINLAKETYSETTAAAEKLETITTLDGDDQ